jgi:hypothetical protein
MLLEAIELGGMTSLVVDLTLSLGLLFLLINLTIELIYPLLDPRLRNGGQETEQLQEQQSWRERLEGLVDGLAEWWAGLRHSLPGARREKPALSPLPVVSPPFIPPNGGERGGENSEAAPRPSHALWILRSVLHNPALLVGTLLVLGFFGLALFGRRTIDRGQSIRGPRGDDD